MSIQSAMTIYEVNIRVLSDAYTEYTTWLEEHIQEMLQLDGFLAAEWFEVELDQETQELEEAVRQAVRLDESVPAELREAVATPIHSRMLTIHYQLSDRDSLEDYFTDHADRMRNKGMERFGEMFAATRRVMKRTKQFQREGEEL